MNIFKKCYRKLIIKKYKKTGLILGDAISYSFMGPIHNFDKLVKKFLILEEKISSFGYLPYDLSFFIQSGGYGKELPTLETGTQQEIEFVKKENLATLEASNFVQKHENTIIKKFFNN